MPPQFLYHYTSIESLVYILKNKSIRFNSLGQVDDLNEGKSEDYKSFGNYFFVSCWTDLEEESIPFWNMYTDKMKGVRIKLPSDLFNDHWIVFGEEYRVKLSANHSIVPQSNTFGLKYWVLPTHNNYFRKVEYTDEVSKLKPTLKVVEGDRFSISFDKLGIYKSKHWIFQSEWRFIMKIFPVATNLSDIPIDSDLVQESVIAIERGDPIPFTYFDVEVNEAQLKNMEIVVGPKTSQADKLIVESIVESIIQVL
jgi:hypothetical protein